VAGVLAAPRAASSTYAAAARRLHVP